MKVILFAVLILAQEANILSLKLINHELFQTVFYFVAGWLKVLFNGLLYVESSSVIIGMLSGSEFPYGTMIITLSFINPFFYQFVHTPPFHN